MLRRLFNINTRSLSFFFFSSSFLPLSHPFFSFPPFFLSLLNSLSLHSDRRVKKRVMRSTWIQQINAATRQVISLLLSSFLFPFPFPFPLFMYRKLFFLLPKQSPISLLLLQSQTLSLSSTAYCTVRDIPCACSLSPSSSLFLSVMEHFLFSNPLSPFSFGL